LRLYSAVLVSQTSHSTERYNTIRSRSTNQFCEQSTTFFFIPYSSSCPLSGVCYRVPPRSLGSRRCIRVGLHLFFLIFFFVRRSRLHWSILGGQ
jgi:hypothetical protein